ncbi:MAG: LptF/LptG family permease [Endomicrobium sp.]|jgi:lipopolysaccharide export system permease protein|nr:LptF/LptG family permease [Endomicrobium sp.]
MAYIIIMKKLHSYIIKEFLNSFFFGVMVFSLLLIINIVFDMANLLISKGVPFFLIFKLFIFYIPNILTLSIPMATLFGVLLVYGRLSSDNEITAMKSSGLKYMTLTIPIIIFICVISIFLLFFNHFLAPSINYYQKNIFEKIITKRPLVKFNEKSITKLKDYNIYVNKVKNINNTLLGVSIYKFENKNTDNDIKSTKKRNILPQNDDGAWRISASDAKVITLENGIQFTLHKGYWQKASISDINNMLHMTFKTYIFFIPLEKNEKRKNVTISQIKSPELIKIIKTNKKLGLPTEPYEVDLWIRWILAFAPIAFVLIALPIGIMLPKSSKARGLVISLGITIIYYSLLVVAINLGEKHYAPISVIMWIPNFLIAIIGIYLLKKMIKK